MGIFFRVSCVAIAAILFSSNSLLQAQLDLLKVSIETQRNSATELALKEVVTFRYDEDSFSNVQSTLQEMMRLNFVLSDSAKDDLLTEDELMTCELADVPLNRALEVLLKPHNATYFIDEGIVTIISCDDRHEEYTLRTKMFDCRQLIEKMRKPAMAVHRHRGGGFGGGLFSIPSQAISEVQLSDSRCMAGVSSMQSPQQEQKELTPEEIFDMKCELLVETIAGAISQTSWLKAGGNCQIKFIDGIMIVSQAESELRKIDAFLVDLHAQMGLKLPNHQVAKVRPSKMIELPAKKPAKAVKDLDNPIGDIDPFGGTKAEAADPTNPFGVGAPMTLTHSSRRSPGCA